MFVFIVTESIFTQVAKLMKKFWYQDWVVERFRSNQDGETKKTSNFVDVPPFDGSVPYPGSRYWADKEKKKSNVTAGFVMCWVALLILK